MSAFLNYEGYHEDDMDHLISINFSARLLIIACLSDPFILTLLKYIDR